MSRNSILKCTPCLLVLLDCLAGNYYYYYFSNLIISIAIHQQYAECNRVGIKVKSAVMGLIYRKSLRLSRVKSGAGEVINLLTGDVGIINDDVLNFHLFGELLLKLQ